MVHTYTYTTAQAPSGSNLVSFVHTHDLNVKMMKGLVMPFSDRIADKLLYDVKSYKVIYKTEYKGRTIHASGRIFIPQGTAEALPILSLQHGTTFSKYDVPSEQNNLSGMELFAAGGFITVMPDYIGYGASSEYVHPYYDSHHAATTVINLIKAAKEILKGQNVRFNEDLYLAGYSEGGFVTMATHKAIEENPKFGLKVTASAAGAGGYDLEDMSKRVVQGSTYPYPAYLAFIIHAYNHTYNWNKPLSYFFNEKYAHSLESMLKEGKDGWAINQKLSSNISELFNERFLKSLNEGKETEISGALHKNDLKGWKPKAPIRLYHGTSDNIVPFENSMKMIEHFKKNSVHNVNLIPIQGGTHSSSLLPMVRYMIEWFDTFPKAA